MNIHHTSRKLLNIIIVIGLMLGLLSGFSFTSSAYAADTNAATAPADRSLPESETGLYIVQLDAPTVSSYKGGIAGLDATSPEVTGARRLDPSSPDSQAYLAYVQAQQQALISDMEAVFGHAVDVVFSYEYALNAVAVRISHEEALQAFELPNVKNVFPDLLDEPDTDMGPALIGAPSIWNGDTIGEIDTKGEGIVIGMIDTGINSQHPSFSATGGDGYVHVNPYGAGVFHGWCTTNPGFCNDKLIGAYGLNPVDGDPEDIDGHGSHTGSTAGGNWHVAEFMVGTDTYTRTISGVAPHANIVAYKVCNPSCPQTASVAAVNLAIGSDDVDVINFSISGSDAPWNNSVDLAFLEAFNAGIFVSASAGNSGPGAHTVAHTGPWNSTVAASTHSRVIANTLDVTAAGGSLTNIAAVPSEGTLIGADFTDNIKWAGDVDPANLNACVAFPANSFSGVVGMAIRGDCTFDIKVDNLFNAGATGAVIYNNVGGPPSVMGAVTSPIPAVMVTNADGLDIVALIGGDPTASTTIYAGTELFLNPAWEDILAGFSSRGPSTYELVKPDYTAPGVNILAAVESIGGIPEQYGFLAGTSMSSPHSAGSGALMMALRPTWTIAEIRSAMNSTSNPVPVKKEDGITPATPYDTGSGRLDLYGAGNAGLVMNETYANFQAANPALGGEPKTLNQPSMVDYDCSGSCTWTRTVKSVLPAAGTWTATTSGDTGLNITVTPDQFTLSPGESVELTITANVSAAPGTTLFGDVTLTPTAGFTTRLPVVVISGAAPVISVDPTEIISIQPAELVTETLTISNLGDADLDWEIYDGTPAATWSDNFDSYATGSQMHGQGGWKGWFNDPGAGALTSDAQARSTPNSVAILGASDLVHEYSGYTNASWTYSAWQYIPSSHTGVSYFILLNTYNDAGVGLNWSTQVNFDASTHMVVNDGPAGGSTPIIHDQWVEIKVVIDLDTDTQTFFYGGTQLFTGSWTDGLSGGGALNIGAVDLFANGASTVYYDDISLMPTGTPACGVWGDVPWLSTVPTNGMTPPAGSTPVDVLLDATGLSLGTYTAELCVSSNDPATPLISVPVTMTVVAESDLALTKLDSPDPVKVGELITYTLEVTNNGADDATGVTLVDTLPAGVTFHHASPGCVEAGGVVTCDIGALANGASETVEIVVMAPLSPGMITNTAMVDSDGVDPNPGDNTATQDTTVNPDILMFYLPLISR